MTMGVIAIAGIPPLAGFFSKDEILFRAFSSDNPLGKLLWFVGLVTAGMTSFYMFRLWFKTFFGESHFDEHHVEGHANEAGLDSGHAHHGHGVHESPLIMTLPLMVLALLSVIGGWVGIPSALGGHNEIEHFLAPVFESGQAHVTLEAVPAPLPTQGHGLELALAAVSVLVALLGFFIAYVLYYKKPGTAATFAKRFPALYRIVENKFYVDEIYHTLFVAPLLIFSRLFLGVFIDGGVVNGSAYGASAATRGLGALVRRIQSGNIRSYAGWLAIGAAAVLAVMIFGHSLWLH
jgi:NADH-quinone oxidoreductase subunit L